MEAKKHVFTTIEKKVLLDALKKFKNIIENKNTDGATLSAKNSAWRRVELSYNASPLINSQATNQQLRRLWSNLKQRHREALTKERQNRLATGGGSPSIDPDVAQVAPSLITGIDEALDSDTLHNEVIVLFRQDIKPALSLPSPNTSQAQSNLCMSPTQTQATLSLPPSPTISTTQTQPTLSLPPAPDCIPPMTSKLSSAVSLQRQKTILIKKEFESRLKRANELHHIEIALAREKLREAKARADLAELMLYNYSTGK